MFKTVLNKKVELGYEFYKVIYDNKSLEDKERTEAYNTMNVIITIANVYEQGADIHCGQLFVCEDWLEPGKYSKIIELIGG